jgi:hypothetical protein
MKTFELFPRYDRRKSFYGKARIVEHENGDKDLISYTTTVASIKNNILYVYGWFSNTTARHINEFLQQNGFAPMTKKEMEAF